MKGYREEAKESMEFVYKGDVGEEFERMAETITNLCCQPISGSISDDSTSTNSVDIDTNSTGNDAGKVNQVQRDAQNMFSSRYRHIMLLGVGLLVLQQFSGQPAVLAYSRVLFEAAGWNSHSSVVTVLIMGVASSLTVAFVDKLGRKILLMTGSFLMTCSVSVLAIAFWNWDEDYGLSDTKKVLVLGGMFVFIASYQIGFGPITWTVLSEVYPIEIRGKAMAFSVEVNFLCKFLSQLFFPIIQDFFGWGSTFLIFTGTCLAGLVFVYLTVPETKGMSLEEIQQHIAKPTNDTPPSEIMDHPLESSLLDKESSYVPPRDLNPIS
jgi:MFS family permease